MAGLSVSGVGSGIDIASLVDQLVSAERAPEASRLSRVSSDVKLKLSALGTLNSAFSGLQASLNGLKSGSAFGGRLVTSSAESVFTASAEAGAQTGSYEVEVLALASAHKLASAPLAASTGLGAGVLRVTVGSTAFDVTIAAGQDTPDKIRDAISSAATAAGARLGVSLIHGDSGDSLVFTSGASGSANAITIKRTSGAAGLDALVYDPGTLTSLSQRTAAADAQLRVDGVLRTSASNQVSTAVPGVTISLKSAAPGAVHQLGVAADNTATTKAVSDFVTAYNSAVDAMGRVTAYGGATGKSGALIGDAMVRSVESQLRSLVGSALGPAAGLGLNSGTDGKLTLDSARLGQSLGSTATATQDRLKTLATSLQGVVGNYVGTDGMLTQRTNSLNQRLRDVDKRTADLDVRMDQVRQRYTRQFTAMDSMVAQLNNTSSYLSQALASLTGSASE